jgi:superfamily I DNA/RNA helicase
VVAIHRAKHLTEQLMGQLDGVGGEKAILFTTFTRNLAQAIEEDLRSLGGGDLLDIVDVLNVDRISYRIVQDAEGAPPNLANNDLVDRLWQQVIDERGLKFSPSFLNTEWEQVILAQNLASRADYFTASRAGRGIPLDRRSRAAVWKAVEELTKLLKRHQARTYLQLADAAAGYLALRAVKPYRHVIVDEGQDLHESQWRLLRAIVDETADDIFIVGDSHQRIYDRRSSLSKVGINIRGRSKKLKINYRTTHEIMAWGLSLLGEGTFDDLDQGEDNHDFAGYHSFRHGPTPTYSSHDSRGDQLTAMAEQVTRWVADGVPEEDIAVVARSAKRSFDGIIKALTDVGRQTCILPPDMPRAVGVRIGTMHRMKGLEFLRVAIVDLRDDWYPERSAITSDNDPAQRAADLQRERCLLYVAATRARDGLWLGWYNKPSRFLDAVGVESAGSVTDGS